VAQRFREVCPSFVWAPLKIEKENSLLRKVLIKAKLKTLQGDKSLYSFADFL